MREQVYITGHRNPDTDSICAAIGYAELKNKRGEIDAIPVRLGELNQETRFVLDYFNVEAPRFVDTMKPQVEDLFLDQAYCVAPYISLNKALDLIQDNHLNNIPVVDEEESLIGIVSLSNLTRCYTEVWDDRILGRADTPIDNIIGVLSAEIINLPKKPREYNGRMLVSAMDPKKCTEIEENDLVIVGDREDAQEEAIDRNVSLLILSGGDVLCDRLVEKAKANNVTVISTSYNTFMTTRLLPQAVPVSYVMTKDNLVAFYLDDYVEDIRNIMADTRYRSYPVLNHQNKVIGSISRFHLISNKKKKLILVDHNERNQSVADIEEADIIEIIDHHRVANVATSGPIYFRNLPVGSTCTIISMMFFEQGLRPTKKVAGLLCAAIISDTLLFRSPTSTDLDRRILHRMAKIANIDVDDFAMKMFKAGTSLENKKPSDILKGDVKRFTIEGEQVRVAQVFTMDLESLEMIKDNLIIRMEELLKEQNEDVFVLMMTDIFKETSEIIVVGGFEDAIASEFGETLEDKSFLSQGTLSRKKQVIPKINAAISKSKNA